MRETMPLPFLASSAIFVKEDKKAALLITPQVLHNKRDFWRAIIFARAVSITLANNAPCLSSVQICGVSPEQWRLRSGSGFEIV